MTTTNFNAGVHGHVYTGEYVIALYISLHIYTLCILSIAGGYEAINLTNSVKNYAVIVKYTM